MTELVVVVVLFSPVTELVDVLVVVVLVVTVALPVSTGGSVELVVFSPTVVVVVVVVFVELVLVFFAPPPQADRASRLAETSAVEMIFMCIPLLNMQPDHGPEEHDLSTAAIVRRKIRKVWAAGATHPASFFQSDPVFRMRFARPPVGNCRVQRFA